MLGYKPVMRKNTNTRYFCRKLEFFPNPYVPNIRHGFSAENPSENVFVVTLFLVFTHCGRNGL